MTAERTPTAGVDVEREARIGELIRARLHLEVEDPETELLDTGLIDSLAFVELLVIIRNEFGVDVEVDDLDMENFRTIRRISAFIGERAADGDSAS